MKNSIKTTGAVFILGVAMVAFAKSPKAKTAGPQELGPGSYQATVKALVCEGCGPMVQKTISRQEGIESTEVDQATRLVTFRVKPGSKVKLANLQKALDQSASDMGMGADYTLLDVKPAGKRRT